MKLGIIADSPLLTTGFGVECREVAEALAQAGHDVTCFGLKGSADDRVDGLAFRIWPVDPASAWDLLLREFFAQEQPDQLIILIDLFNLREVIDYCRTAGWNGTTIVYLTPDGLPAYDEYVDVLRTLRHCVVTTEFCKQYLNGKGIPARLVAPPGVNRELFKPLSHRDELRRAAGLADRFVVGVFGRNSERKQQPRVLKALSIIRDPETVLYLHCQPRGYWHLDQIARDLKLSDQVLFPAFESETRGVTQQSRVAPTGNTVSVKSSAAMPAEYGYVERIACCDLIINCAHSGDVEHIIMESQACGVPLAHTDDEGIMAEAVGDSALLLKSLEAGWGRIGERIFLVDPNSIAEAIEIVKQDKNMREQLRARGLRNAERFSWSRLRQTMVDLVQAPGRVA